MWRGAGSVEKFYFVYLQANTVKLSRGSCAQDEPGKGSELAVLIVDLADLWLEEATVR